MMTTEIVHLPPTQIDRPAQLAQADQNPALVYLARLQESSRRPMCQSLQAIVDIMEQDAGIESFPWHLLQYQHTTAIRTALAAKYSASTANRHLSALRGVLKEAWRLGYMSAEDEQRATDLKPIKGSTASQAESGRHLSKGEIGALIAACADGTKTGVRDAAIIAIAYSCGLRRSEVAKLDIGDYDAEQGSLRIRQGKGNKMRVVYVANGAADALQDWLQIRGAGAGALFYGSRRGDNLQNSGMTDQAIYNILQARAEQSGVKSFTPHDLRRTFAGDMLDAGADISTVQKLMGHSNTSTTAGYDRRDAKAKKAASSLLHVPYIRTK